MRDISFFFVNILDSLNAFWEREFRLFILKNFSKSLIDIQRPPVDCSHRRSERRKTACLPEV
jgi:hypothetical protein